MNRRQHRQQWQQLCDRRDVREKSCPSFPKLPSKRCKTTQIISFYFFIYYNLRLEILKNMVHNTWASPRNISSLRFLFWFSNDFLRSNHNYIDLTLFISLFHTLFITIYWTRIMPIRRIGCAVGFGRWKEDNTDNNDNSCMTEMICEKKLSPLS